jgi:hypothetical protein
MRKVQIAVALGAVAITAVAAASGAAAKGATEVNGSVAIIATPIDETVPPATKPTTTQVIVTGKVKAREACRSRRKIEFIEVTPSGSYVQAITAVSSRKGSFTATLPFDKTGLTSKQTGGSITVSATAKQVTRKDADGAKVKCLEATGITDFAATL